MYIEIFLLLVERAQPGADSNRTTNIGEFFLNDSFVIKNLMVWALCNPIVYIMLISVLWCNRDMCTLI